MAEPDTKKVDELLSAVRRDIILLTGTIKSGKIEITIEFNLSQGFIGDCYIKNHTRLKV
jgi:hypothetical protein